MRTGMTRVLFVAALLAGSGTNAAENGVAILDVRVFDGERTRESVDVLIHDGRIARIADALEVPDGVERYDGTGRTLLPGLIDAHVHVWGDARRDALRFGVTTVLDMFSDRRQLPAAKRQRDSLERSEQADLWSAGTLATVENGHGTQFGGNIPTLSSPGDAAAWVAGRKREGSDYIKIIREDLSVYDDQRRLPTLDAATTAALIDAAHDAGLEAVVHASARDVARRALEDGADGLAHAFQDAPADEAFVRLAKDSGAFMIPTLTVIAGLSGEQSEIRDDPRIEPWLDAAQRDSLNARSWSDEPLPELIVNARETVRRLHQAGVPILAGTDAPNPNTAHGASLHEELRRLTGAGLGNEAALAAATSVPADAFGLEDRGRIAAGSRADLLLVEGDPTVDIGATRRIVGIWKNGWRVDRELPAQEAGEPSAAVDGDLISDFEQDTVASRYGHGWEVTTDQRMNGNSTAGIERISGGARGSKGALEVTGEVKSGFAFPWAGAMFFPGDRPMAPVDWSNRSVLAFRVRGDGREYVVMLFSGESSAGQPPSQSFAAGPEWTEVRLPIAGFRNGDPAAVTGVAFTASRPHGEFRFLLDDVAVE